jgi:TetR/AcrR family transcriptional repressor of lmrAB and yxaGH operons
MSDSQDTRARPETRARLVRAAEQLFRVQGYAGTGLKQLTAAAGAPWGSLYHFFPKGKAELAAAAAAHAGAIYAEGWRRAFEQADDPAEAVWRIFEGEVRVLEGSDYRNGCPVASMTLDVASLDEDLRRACDGAFGQWLAAMSQGFEAHGAAPDAADALARFVLAAIEGAIVLARAAKSPAALKDTGGFVRAVIAREAEGWTGS